MKYMNKVKTFFKRISKDESGQGMAEYILLLVIVVGLVVALGPKIKGKVMEKMGQVESGMDEVGK